VQKLAEYLADLEAHLLLWQANYVAWIPDHSERAVVYLDDNAQHGIPFQKVVPRSSATFFGKLGLEDNHDLLGRPTTHCC